MVLDLVFTDVQMPGTMDGIKLAQYIRDRWPPVKLIIASGAAILEESSLPEGSRFFPKPYQDHAIADAMARLLSSEDGLPTGRHDLTVAISCPPRMRGVVAYQEKPRYSPQREEMKAGEKENPGDPGAGMTASAGLVTGVHSPRVDITKDTTTLYASDRDVFLFLVDELSPIGAGRLPDLYFRGFYCWNSEVGAKTLGMVSFYLRGVCQNRNLWDVEDFEEITIRHTQGLEAHRHPLRQIAHTLFSAICIAAAVVFWL